MTRRSRSNQLSFQRKPDGKHGGWRPGAGRKKRPGAVSHGPRVRFAARYPQHVTLRLADGVESIARMWLMKIIRGAIAASHKPSFRIVEFNVLSNHIHCITEAHGAETLARGMQGFEVRLARRLNSAMKRRGKLFAQRYHARQLRTPREVRHALRYVLLNRKHHAAEQKFAQRWFDPFSSAAWFDGWAAAFTVTTGWKREHVAMRAPTAKAATWLLAKGWRRHGLARFDEAPAT